MKELIAICPYVKCRQIIFRKAKTQIQADKSDVLEFDTKCPHCKNLVRVKLSINIKTSPVYI